MTASSNEKQNAPAFETIPSCIPFCGLSAAMEKFTLLKHSGLRLLEQVRQPKEEQIDLQQRP